MIRTKHQAELEAIRRWGRYGEKDGQPFHAQLVLEQRKTRSGHLCTVGFLNRIGGFMFMSVKCSGSSWQNAFDTYDHMQEERRLFNEWKDQPCPKCSRTMRVDGTRGPMPRKWMPNYSAAKRCNARGGRRFSEHWPSVDFVDGAFVVQCIACKDAAIGKTLIAWGEAMRSATDDGSTAKTNGSCKAKEDA